MSDSPHNRGYRCPECGTEMNVRKPREDPPLRQQLLELTGLAAILAGGFGAILLLMLVISG